MYMVDDGLYMPCAIDDPGAVQFGVPECIKKIEKPLWEYIKPFRCVFRLNACVPYAFIRLRISFIVRVYVNVHVVVVNLH